MFNSYVSGNIVIVRNETLKQAMNGFVIKKSVRSDSRTNIAKFQIKFKNVLNQNIFLKISYRNTW